MFFLSAAAQYVDNQEDDGSRVIVVDYENLYSKWSSASSSALQHITIDTGETFWSLNLVINESRPTIEEGRVLLIQFQDDSVMELKNKMAIGTLDAVLQTSCYGSWYTVSPMYDLTPEQFNKLLTEPVVKVRIEFDTEYVDRDIKSKDFKKRMNKQYEQINNLLSRSHNVRDGF